jgi:hypothetical protein
MPGTGKTFTTCMLLKILLDQGKRVLVTSYTHLSLDTIILRFNEIFPKDKKAMVRMVPSRSGMGNPVITQVTYSGNAYKNFEDFDNFFEEKKIFFTTSLS